MITVIIASASARAGESAAEGPERRLADLLERLHPESDLPGVVRPFTRRAHPHRGAETALVGVLDRADVAVGLLLTVGREGLWSVGVGVGSEGRSDVPEGRASDLRAAARALRRASSAPGRVAVEVGAGAAAARGELIESSLQLVVELEQRRTQDGQAAGALVDRGRTQREAAQELEISQQAISARLRNGLWHESRRLAAATAALLQEVVDSGRWLRGVGDPAGWTLSPSRSLKAGSRRNPWDVRAQGCR